MFLVNEAVLFAKSMMESLTVDGDAIEFDLEEEMIIGEADATDIEWDLSDEFEMGDVNLEDANEIEFDLDVICSELRLNEPDLWILLLLFALKLYQNINVYFWIHHKIIT